MTKRSRILTLVLAAVLSVPAAAATAPSASARPAGPDYRCILDAFGQGPGGKITFRRVVNTRVEVSKTSALVSWRPFSWSLLSLSGSPDGETTTQLVASTDGKLRIVETEWRPGSSSLGLRVLKVVGRGYPNRLVTFSEGRLFWVGKDRHLHRATWIEKKERFVRPKTLPVTVTGATAMASHWTERGIRIHWTDRAGALHVIAVAGARSTDTVVRSSGYRTVTGLRSGDCMSPNYANVRPYLGLLTVDRETGIAHFRRVLRPGAADGGTLTKARRVERSDWTWRRLG